MSARATLDKYTARTGWNTDTLLDLCLTYIDNQDSPEAFDDFIAVQAEDEAPGCVWCKEPLEDAHTDQAWCSNQQCVSNAD